MENEVLFSLTATSDPARRIVRANPQFQDPVKRDTLIFKPSNQSKAAGHLVNFGRMRANHDVYLPENGYSG